MKKVKHRASLLLVLVAVMVLGLGLYIFRFVSHGGEWASFAANQNETSAHGKICDRNGKRLLTFSDGEKVYADDWLTRESTLHAVGDRDGNIGTGALSVFASDLMGYNIVSGTNAARLGGTVKLSIDADVNAAAYSALDGRKGAVAVSDCDTGELVCMVSSTSFDPDDMPYSFDDEYYDGVYINRFLSSTYTPGSIFKLVTLAAAIENIDDLFDRTFTCEGACVIDDTDITCTSEHGEMTIEDALAVSCNCVFAELAVELGGETIQKYAEKYGLLDSVLIDGVQSAKGSFTVHPEGSGELAWSGVGQSTDTVNATSFLRLMTAIANGGRASELTMLKSSKSADKTRIMDPDTAEKLAEMMNYNVYLSYGEENFPDIELYAKSGTAEVGSDISPHAWFVGFAKAEGKTYAFTVIIENGGWGSSEAGYVANEVLQKVFFG